MSTTLQNLTPKKPNYNFSNTLLTEHTLGNVATNSSCQYSEGYKLSGNVSWRRQDLKTIMNDDASLARSRQVEGAI